MAESASGDQARLVGVLDAEDKGAAVMAGEQPVEEGRADVTHMGDTRGTGSEAYSKRMLS